MAASASAWCRGRPCSTTVSGSTSPASPRPAGLTGHSHDREDWGCERKSKPLLLVDKHAGLAPSGKGWRVPHRRLAACGLDRPPRARQGLAKQLRISGKRRVSFSQREIRRTGIAPLVNAVRSKYPELFASGSQKSTRSCGISHLLAIGVRRLDAWNRYEKAAT